MAISPYIAAMRAHVGSMRLLLPSVSAHIFDSDERLLLVRQRESGVWSTPGGAIEPDEDPVDAVIRETREETGLEVRPRRLLAAYGGPEFVVRYANGDESQYVIIAYHCEVVGGAPEADGDEIDLVRYVPLQEALGLELTPWLRAVAERVFAPPG
jgi:ADP-ribose pyrophosphatase YjhB (NUDIX family)